MGEYEEVGGKAIFGREGKSVRQLDIKMLKKGKFIIIDKEQD